MDYSGHPFFGARSRLRACVRSPTGLARADSATNCSRLAFRRRRARGALPRTGCGLPPHDERVRTVRRRFSNNNFRDKAARLMHSPYAPPLWHSRAAARLPASLRGPSLGCKPRLAFEGQAGQPGNAGSASLHMPSLGAVQMEHAMVFRLIASRSSARCRSAANSAGPKEPGWYSRQPASDREPPKSVPFPIAHALGFGRAKGRVGPFSHNCADNPRYGSSDKGEDTRSPFGTRYVRRAVRALVELRRCESQPLSREPSPAFKFRRDSRY